MITSHFLKCNYWDVCSTPCFAACVNMTVALPAKCKYPGEVVVEDSESNNLRCTPEQTCECSTDMNLLQVECTQYNETAHSCTQSDRQVVVVTEAGNNRDDPCCPSYGCECQPCQDKPVNCSNGYKLEDHKKVGDCCPNWTCVCDVCFHEGKVINRGASFEVYDSLGCKSKLACTDEKISNETDSCFRLSEMWSERGACETESEFEQRKCNLTFEHVVRVTYNESQEDPNLCCEEYECVCNNITHLQDLGLCLEEAECSSVGCEPHSTEECGCITSSHCGKITTFVWLLEKRIIAFFVEFLLVSDCNPSKCPSAPNCTDCYEMKMHPASPPGTRDYRCLNNTCCPTYECRPVSCPTSEPVTCEANENKTKVWLNLRHFSCSCLTMRKKRKSSEIK